MCTCTSFMLPLERSKDDTYVYYLVTQSDETLSLGISSSPVYIDKHLSVLCYNLHPRHIPHDKIFQVEVFSKYADILLADLLATYPKAMQNYLAMKEHIDSILKIAKSKQVDLAIMINKLTDIYNNNVKAYGDFNKEVNYAKIGY